MIQQYIFSHKVFHPRTHFDGDVLPPSCALFASLGDDHQQDDVIIPVTSSLRCRTGLATSATDLLKHRFR